MTDADYFKTSASVVAEAGFDKAARIPSAFDSHSFYRRLPILVLNARDERSIVLADRSSNLRGCAARKRKDCWRSEDLPQQSGQCSWFVDIQKSVIDAPASVEREHIRDLLTLLSSHLDQG